MATISSLKDEQGSQRPSGCVFVGSSKWKIGTMISGNSSLCPFKARTKTWKNLYKSGGSRYTSLTDQNSCLYSQHHIGYRILEFRFLHPLPPGPACSFSPTRPLPPRLADFKLPPQNNSKLPLVLATLHSISCPFKLHLLGELWFFKESEE